MKISCYIFKLLLVAAMLQMASCGYQPHNARHPLFINAERARRQGKPEQAVDFYRRYLLIKPDSAPAHLALATVYDESQDKPLDAVYHYQRYLELVPKAANRKVIEKWLEAARKKYYMRARTAYNDPENVAALQNELVELNREFKRLNEQNASYIRTFKQYKQLFLAQKRKIAGLERKLNAALADSEVSGKRVKELGQELEALKAKAASVKKTENTQLENAGKTVKEETPEVKEEQVPADGEHGQTGVVALPEAKTPPESAEPAKAVKPEPEREAALKVKTAEPAKAKPEFYTVKRGDTLMRISRKVYGSSRHYRIIMDANRENLSSEKELRPGQVLRIPKSPASF